MIERKRYHILLGLLLMAFGLLGQSSALHHKLSGDTLLLRYEPKQVYEWLPTISEGLRFVIINVESGQSVVDTLVFPESSSYISDHETETESDYLLVAGLIHIDAVPSDLVEETFPVEEYTIFERDEARLAIINYTLHSDFNLTKFAGLGIEYKGLDLAFNYKLEVFLGEASAPIHSVLFIPSEYEIPEVPNLEVKWQNRKVDLTWNSKLSNPYFYGYRISYGINDGFHIPLSEEPYINVMDTSDLDIFHYIKAFSELVSNDSIYTFRLRGCDYFGKNSNGYNEVIGQGRVGIGLSPLLSKYETLSSNEVDLAWTILPEFENDIESWNVYHSQEYEGPYTADTIGLDAETRAIVRPIPSSWNYFRIGVVDDLGIEVSSFPQLVMSYDTTPPAAPIGLSYEFISDNALMISWDENKEEDIYGYKVFYVFDTTQTMGLINEFYLTETEVLDTLFLASGHEKVYYMVIAADNRNNISDFSDFLEVGVPDVLPPMPPIFYNHQPDPGKTTLFWNNSPSEDIVRVDLLRQSELAPGTWELIASFDGSHVPETYVDTLMDLDVAYQYTMVAVDEVDLRSEPSPPIVSFMLPPEKNINVNDFSVAEEGRKVIITPNFSHPEIFQIWVYRKIGDKPPGVHRIIEPGRNKFFAEDWIRDGDEKVVYFLQVYFENGGQTPFSERKSVGL